MAVSLPNFKHLKPLDQYERDMIDFESRVEDFHHMIPGTMRRLRVASNTTVEGRRMRQEWRHCAEEYQENARIMSERGQDIDGDFGVGVINGLTLTFVLFAAALLAWAAIKAWGM